jgi:RNA polymerase sigma-70 factor (ECF subfamily)
VDAAEERDEELYRAERGRLFGLAYRMLGSVSEAEEVVQDAFLRYEGVDRGEIREPGAYLTTIATRLSIDRLKSARAERETYVGSWLPEPLLLDEVDMPGDVARAESISMAFLVLLETLSPLERAVFLLREAFEYDYAAIGEIVERTPENCRQISLRARRRVADGRPRFEPSREEREEITRRFFAAAREGEKDDLLELLAEDAVLYGDGGGRAPAFGTPLQGRERVAAALLALLRTAGEIGAHFEPTWVNGQPGARFLSADGGLINVVSLDILDGRVEAVRSVVNPEKLEHLGRLADVSALLADRRRR